MESGYVLSMDTLLREIEKLRAFYRSNLESSGAGEEGMEPDTSEASDSVRHTNAGEVDSAALRVSSRAEKGMESGSTHGASGSVRHTGTGKVDIATFQVSSRTEALLLLRKGSEYFQREEPNSPIPLLINRALRISEMNFLELLEDIAPDALSRGRDVFGVKEE
jgi:type VI secretion system protein ImpA